MEARDESKVGDEKATGDYKAGDENQLQNYSKIEFIKTIHLKMELSPDNTIFHNENGGKESFSPFSLQVFLMLKGIKIYAFHTSLDNKNMEKRNGVVLTLIFKFQVFLFL